MMAHLPNLQAWTNGFLKFPELQNKPTGNRNPQWNTASPSALPCIQSQTTVCIDQDSSRTVRSGESTTFVANGRPKICVAAEQKLILTLKTTKQDRNLQESEFTYVYICGIDQLKSNKCHGARPKADYSFTIFTLYPWLCCAAFKG